MKKFKNGQMVVWDGQVMCRVLNGKPNADGLIQLESIYGHPYLEPTKRLRLAKRRDYVETISDMLYICLRNNVYEETDKMYAKISQYFHEKVKNL